MASRVQSKSAAGDSVSTLSVTLDGATTSGNALIVIYSCFYGSGAAPVPYATIVDNASPPSSFTASPGDVSVGFQGTLCIASAFGIAGKAAGTHTVTVTPTGGATWYVLTVIEVNGITAFDKGQTHLGVGDVGLYTSTALATATSQPNEYLVGAHGINNLNALGAVPATGWTIVPLQSGATEVKNGFNRMFAQDQVVSSSATYASNGTADVFDQNVIACYRATSGGGGAITATLTQTLTDSTCSATAKALVTGTLTQALDPLTCSATAKALVAGTLTQTLGALTCSATLITNVNTVLYAKAAGGNWSSASTWSAISSAGTDSAGPPQATTPYDVVLDAGSGNVTIDSIAASCRSLKCTGYTGTLTHNTGVTLAIGHFTAGPSNVLLELAAGMTYSPADTTALVSLNSSVTSSPQTVKSAGKTYGAVTHNGTGSTVLLDAMTVTGDFIASAGTFNTAGFTLTCLTYSAAGTGTSTWGASTINITRTAAGTVFAATGTHAINAGTSNLVIQTSSGVARTFAGGGLTYYDVSYTVAGSAGGLTITGANTFHTLSISDASNARVLTLPAGVTTVVTTFNVHGAAGKAISVGSSSPGIAATLSSSSNQSCQYLTLSDSTATGGGTFYAGTTSTNFARNTGWLFTDPAWTLTQTLGALTCHASAVTQDYGLMVATDGATAYWPLDDPAGSVTARETISHSRPGALVGDVVAGRPGFWGRAMDFRGAKAAGGGAGHIDLNVGGPPSGVVTTLPFSIDLWINRRNVDVTRSVWQTGPTTPAETPPPTPGALSITAVATNTPTPPASPYDRMLVSVNYPANAFTGGTSIVTRLRWHHIAVTYNGTELRFYQDGVWESFVDLTMSQDAVLPSWLGDYPWAPDGGYAFDGKMQAVAVYGTALTTAQVLAHYRMGAALAGFGARRPLSVLDLVGDDDMLRYNIATPITPSDSNNLARATDAIYVGVSGDLAVLLQNGTTRTFVDLAAGSILPMIVTRVNATNTTADSLLALYTQ